MVTNNNIKNNLLAATFFSLLFFSSCEKIILNDPGTFITKTVTTESFRDIVIYDIFDIVLKSDSVYSLQLQGYSDYIDNISLLNDSGTLKISDNNKYSWLPDYPRMKVIISFPAINMITLESPSHITNVDTLKLKSFFLVSSGKTAEVYLILDVDYCAINTGSDDFGYFELKGKAKSCYYYQQGSSIIESRDLVVENCKAYNNSIGDTYLYVTSRLEAHLGSKGNIYYLGSPGEIISESNSSGKLIKYKIR